MDNSGIIGPATTTFFPDSSQSAPTNAVGAEHVQPSYADLRVVSEGTYCRVLKGRRQNQWWALKSLKPDYACQPFYQQMLQKEYDLLVRLHHSGIGLPIGIEDVDGYGPCLVMEYIEGVTLDEFHTDRHGRRRLALQIVEVMAYVHSCQVVHRDLKPSNIMVTQNGQNVKIIDFGLADTDNYAVLKQPAGTPRYISPEQLASPEPDVRNDIYSLGIILDELQLGWPFRRIISRCTGPIDRRYMGAGELLRAMRRAEVRARAFWGTLLMLSTAIAVVFFIFYARFRESSPGESNNAPAQKQELRTSSSEGPSGQQVSALDSQQTQAAPQPPTLSPQLHPAPPTQTSASRFETLCQASQKRLDIYMASNGYNELLCAYQTEPWDPVRFKELETQFHAFFKSAQSELVKIREEAKAELSDAEAQSLNVATNEHFINDYYKPLIAALNEYVQKRLSSSPPDE